MRYLISHTERQPVFLALDEIGTVPPINGLVQKLNTVRSRHLPTMMYWQSTEQMQAYGEKHNQGPNTIMGACDLQIVFRLNDNATAEWMSNRIGTVDRLIESRSVARKNSWYPEITESNQLTKEPIIFPHELSQLENSEIICAYKNAAWRGKATPYYEKFANLE
jgi:type IV secretion system protein VirD4